MCEPARELLGGLLLQLIEFILCKLCLVFELTNLQYDLATCCLPVERVNAVIGNN